MTTAWILVANSSHAKIYQTRLPKLFIDGKDASNLQLIQELDHEESRKKCYDLVSDKSGNYQYGSIGHGKFDVSVDPKTHEAQVFAKEIVELLDKGRMNHDFDELLIIANPRFQGNLMKFIHNNLKKYVAKTIHKDYTQLKPRELVHELNTQI